MSEIPTSTLNTRRNLNIHKTFRRRFWTSSEYIFWTPMYVQFITCLQGAITLLTLEKPLYKWHIHLNRNYKNMVKVKIKKTRGSMFSKFTRKTLKQQHVLGIASFICFYYQANLRVLTNFYYPWYNRKHLWVSDDFRGIKINKFLEIRLILGKKLKINPKISIYLNLTGFPEQQTDCRYISWQFSKQMDIYYLRFSNILFKAVQKCSIFKIHLLRKRSMQKKLAKVHRLNSILQTKLLMVIHKNIRLSCW